MGHTRKAVVTSYSIGHLSFETSNCVISHPSSSLPLSSFQILVTFFTVFTPFFSVSRETFPFHTFSSFVSLHKSSPSSPPSSCLYTHVRNYLKFRSRCHSDIGIFFHHRPILNKIRKTTPKSYRSRGCSRELITRI